MNHLAHFLLASLNKNISQPEVMIGSFLGDYVKGPLTGHYPSGIEAGIHLHRRIDAYTDQHPVVHRSCQQFNPPLRRYAPIITDLVFDHFLALNWSDYHHQTLEEFNLYIFHTSEDLVHHLPKQAALSLISMRDRKVFLNYTEPDFIHLALQHISRRLKRPNNLGTSYEEVLVHFQKLETDFKIFFPELCEFAINHSPACMS